MALTENISLNIKKNRPLNIKNSMRCSKKCVFCNFGDGN